ncbi:MAG: hypothetical protein R3C03_08335 [Pirellulaceae bacterium]
MLSEFKKLPSIRIDSNETQRYYADLETTPIVVFRKHGRPVCPKYSGDWCRTLSVLNCGPVVELDQPQWSWSNSDPVNFNCHSLAIGANAGLRPTDWLEGTSSPYTLNINPAKSLLDRLYDVQATVEAAQTDGYATIQDAKENDTFVLFNSAHNHLIHSGVVKWLDNIPMVISKFGEGPILITSLELIWRFYQNQFDCLLWCRFSPGVPRPAYKAVARSASFVTAFPNCHQ